MKSPLVTIIIRTKNEEKYLGQVLDSVRKQTFSDYEILIVDDNSTDKTEEIGLKYNARIIKIEPGKFTHPYSCNIGAQAANGKYLAFLNGHTIPISRKWLENGLKNFRDPKVAAISSLTFPHKKSTFADKLLYYIPALTIGLFRVKTKSIAAPFFATMNAIIRKDLWEEYNFPMVHEGKGGEDVVWIRHWQKRGYKLVSEPRFRARHSHHLKMHQIPWQIRNWIKMSSQFKTVPEIQKKNF